jgi:hypothetical protein
MSLEIIISNCLISIARLLCKGIFDPAICNTKKSVFSLSWIYGCVWTDNGDNGSSQLFWINRLAVNYFKRIKVHLNSFMLLEQPN